MNAPTRPANGAGSHVALPNPPAPVRGGVSQATSIEQSRAVAEVYAAVLSAKNAPRDQVLAVSRMEDTCRQKETAEDAFFSFRRGGSPVQGPTIHLARELARCWGNIDYGIRELRRDTDGSEILAFAIDLETNTRNSNTFIAPAARFAKGELTALTDPRDVYENNANLGARRVREAIFAVLPRWYRERAVQMCTDTIKHGGGIPLATRIANSVQHFAGIGVTEGQLVARVGKPTGQWTDLDAANLGIVYKTIQRGEQTKNEAFPPEENEF